METRVVTTHIPVDLAERLDDLASRLDRPRGWVLKEALATYVELEEKRRRLTLEALDDVDRGRLIEHSDVEAWLAGLSPPKKKHVTRR